MKPCFADSRSYADLQRISRRDAKALGLKRYFTGASCREGHIAPRYVNSCACVSCSAAEARAWERNQYATNGDAFRAEKREQRARNVVKSLVTGARSRSARRGIAFAISHADVDLPENCPCCGQAMAVRSGDLRNGPNPNSPSIDRLNPALGYVPGNVAIICWRCNNLKRDATVDELRKILNWMARHSDQVSPLKLVG